MAKSPVTTTAEKPATTTRARITAENPASDNQGEDHGNCTTADLTEGAVVNEAELHLSNGQAVFEKVELAG